MSCPHSSNPNSSPSTCSQCLGAEPRVIRRVESATTLEGLTVRRTVVSDGATTRLFTPEHPTKRHEAQSLRRDRRRQRVQNS